MNKYQKQNRKRYWMNRIRHPWPLYKQTVGLSAVVTRADGTVEDLGSISETYTPIWKGWSVERKHGNG